MPKSMTITTRPAGSKIVEIDPVTGEEKIISEDPPTQPNEWPGGNAPPVDDEERGSSPC